MGINKHDLDEADELARLQPLRVTTVILPRRNRRGEELPILRLEDYHTVAFTREAGANATRVAKLLAKANGPITAEDRGSEIKPTQRHSLLDARFGVLLEGPAGLLEEIAAAPRSPALGFVHDAGTLPFIYDVAGSRIHGHPLTTTPGCGLRT